MLDVCQTACHKARVLFSHMVSTSTLVPPSLFYKRLVEVKCDDTLEENLILDNDQLIGLFQRTFVPGPIKNFQGSMAWHCFREALPAQDKLASYVARALTTCPGCERGSETVLHAIVQCPKNAIMLVYVEQL